MDRCGLCPLFGNLSLIGVVPCCSSYRPISLIGVDCKILSTLLARRLEALLSRFILNRHSHTNVRCLLNVLQYAHSTGDRVLCVSLDAAKAFDRVEFDFLFSVLEKFSSGSTFKKWVRVLYCSLMVKALVNGCASVAFHLGRGTRQGCPLSPLLFVLALKLLAEAIRCHNGIF